MSRIKIALAAALWMGAVWSGPSPAAIAAPAQVPEGAASVGRPVKLIRGKSQVFKFANKLKRISVADPNIVEALAATPWEMVLNGKSGGSTSVLVWDETGTLFSYDVSVGGTEGLVERVQNKLTKVLPKEQLKVEQVGKGLAISGIVSSEVAKKVALKVGEAYAPKQVVDNISIEDLPPQVIIKVHFAEIIKSGAVQVGWGYIRALKSGNNAIGIFPGSPGVAPTGTVLPDTQGLVGPQVSFSDVISFFFSTNNRTSNFFLRALKQRGLIRTLAEPHLRVVSGKKAKFLAGGEVPVPVPGADGSVTILFKPFGVELEFKAIVKNTGYVELDITPSVSALDETISLQLSGFSVPGFKRSSTTTTLELRDGQTVAISGLLNEEVIKNLDSLPFIGDIPILGSLFRSKDFREKRTELIVLVTPQIVRPRKVAELTLTQTGFMVGRTPAQSGLGKTR